MDQQTLWQQMLKTSSAQDDDMEALLAGSAQVPLNVQVAAAASPPPVTPQMATPEATALFPLRDVSRSPANNGVNSVARESKATSEQKIYDFLNDAENLDSLSDQKKSVDDYAAKLKAYAEQPTDGFRNLNLQPLAALADRWSGSKIAQSYTPPESVQERAQKAMIMQGNLASLQGNLTKEQNDLMRSKLTALVGIDKANKDNVGTQTFLRERMDNMNHEKNVTAVKNNKELPKLLTTSNNLSNALANYDNAETKAGPQFEELQQSIRRNLGINGVSDLNERKVTQFKNLGLDVAHIQQYLFGVPVDIGASQKEFVDHLRDLVGIQQKNMHDQAKLIINKTIKGNTSMYQKPENQGRYNDLQELAQATIDQFQPAAKPEAPQKELSLEEFRALKKQGKL